MVPVKVKYEDSNSVYSNFAMLDNCSQGYFVKSGLSVSVKLLLVRKLLLRKRHISDAVDRLQVSITSGLDAEWINIP